MRYQRIGPRAAARSGMRSLLPIVVIVPIHDPHSRGRADVRKEQRTKDRREAMTDSAQPFAPRKLLEIKGRRMAYIDEGEGAAIVFAYGNPTTKWR